MVDALQPNDATQVDSDRMQALIIQGAWTRAPIATNIKLTPVAVESRSIR